MIHRRPRHYIRCLESPAHRLRRHLSWGGILIGLGLAVLAHGQGLISERELWLAIPAGLVWVGLVRVAVDRDTVSVVRAAIRFAVAAWLVIAIEQVGGWTFTATWPVLLIGIGLVTLARAIWPRPSCGGDASEEPSW